MTNSTKQDQTVIRDHPAVGLGLMRHMWEMYAETFEGINALAVQRHMMTYAEFAAVCMDDRIHKYVATDAAGVQGMSLLTNDLNAWPLISPAYFERHWPTHYAAKSVWYVGFVAVAEGAPHHLFPELIAAMYEPVKASKGVAVMDFCSYNVASRRLPDVTTRILRRLNASAVGAPIDAQEFWLWEFPDLNV